MASIYDMVRANRPRTSVFDLSHEQKLSASFGKLYPIFLQEIIPGDKFRVSTEIMLRMSPLVAPIMHRVNVYTHFFCTQQITLGQMGRLYHWWKT